MKYKNCHLVAFLNHVYKGIPVAQRILVRTGCTWGEAVVGPHPALSLLGAPALQQLLSKLPWAKYSPRVENSWHEFLQWPFINKMKFISVFTQRFSLYFSPVRGKGSLLQFSWLHTSSSFCRHQRQEDPTMRLVLPLTQGSKSCGIWGLDRCWLSHKALGWVVTASPGHLQGCQGPPWKWALPPLPSACLNSSSSSRIYGTEFQN